jgi:hypothetical protein
VIKVPFRTDKANHLTSPNSGSLRQADFPLTLYYVTVHSMSRAEVSCEPVCCTNCRAAIRCGYVCRDVNSGSGRPRRWQCGKHGCASRYGRVLTYHCTSACYWRHRRARLRAIVLPRKCAGCGEKFAPRRSEARTCSSACRQALYRQRRVTTRHLILRLQKAVTGYGQGAATASRTVSRRTDRLILGDD